MSHIVKAEVGVEHRGTNGALLAIQVGQTYYFPDLGSKIVGTGPNQPMTVSDYLMLAGL